MKTNSYDYYFVGNNLDKVDSSLFKIKNYTSTAPKSVEIYYTFKK